MCPLTVTRVSRWWPWEHAKQGLATTADRHVRPTGSPLACECLGEADGVSCGLADVGVVQEPVDAGGGGGGGGGGGSCA